jgi:hypothetical protein
MMTRRTGEQDLAGWLERVDADNQPELHTFTAGIRHDLAAVTAGLSLPYSSGTTEGNINRLKAIKRQMYGRASLDLLGNASSITHRDPTTQFAPEPMLVAENPAERSHARGRRQYWLGLADTGRRGIWHTQSRPAAG